ncbi:hypothetical protein [Aureispira sp. CCB-E]|uniref:hypothetical protein n=1 Tax=Aureispira sp. CCB-E TaxID=3051121 RepID=UPI002868F8B2|nr:hypothetical protein [Aureispira sp. CCB-E]WMX13100.1 hypothetical protein QP953_19860 [Aureispira sp. CCB-E]
MKIQESKFGQFEAFKVNNLKNVMGGKQIVDSATYRNGQAVDSQASTVYDNWDEARADNCDTLSCHDAEFDCEDMTPTGE